MQGALGGGDSGRAGELQPGHDHDRSRTRRRDVHRTGALGGGRANHRKGTPRRAVAHDGRTDGAQLLPGPGARGRSRAVRGRAHRRQPRGDRQGGGSRAVPRRDGPHRARVSPSGAGPQSPTGRGSSGRHRIPRDHPALVHARRNRGRHRVQPGRVGRNLRAGPRRLADRRGADRGVGARLEGIRDGGRARPARQLHHRLFDRERRSDGRAHRRFDHRGSRADADRQGIPAHAERVARGAARNRRGHRRFERAVRGQPGRRTHGGHRDEPAGVAFVGARLEGDRVPDRQGRRQARGRLHARRAGQRNHRPSDAGIVRTVD